MLIIYIRDLGFLGHHCFYLFMKFEVIHRMLCGMHHLGPFTLVILLAKSPALVVWLCLSTAKFVQLLLP